MANKQSRINQLIFGDTGVTTDFGQIGSESAGTPVTTKNLDTIQALAAYLGGLASIVDSGLQLPRLEDQNSLFLLITTQLRYLLQAGIPEWISTAQYFADVSIVNVAGALYQAKTGTDGTPNVNHNPVGDTTNWRLIYTSFNDGNGGQPPEPKVSVGAKNTLTVGQSCIEDVAAGGYVYSPSCGGSVETTVLTYGATFSGVAEIVHAGDGVNMGTANANMRIKHKRISL